MPKRSMSHGRWMVSDVIWANRVFMRLPSEEDTSLRFDTFSFSVEGIDEWVGISGIEVDTRFEDSATTILYNRPEDISFNLKDDMQLLITYAWTSPGFPSNRRAEVSQKTFFKLISKDSCEVDAFISIAQKIVAFLCFVMNEIVCLDSMSATSDNLRQDIGDGSTALIPVEIYCPSWPYTKNEPAIDEWDMLFKYEDRQNRVESIINRWIDNYELIAPALDLYFLTKAGTLPTLNLQFLTLVQALEIFHRRTSGGKLSLGNRLEKMTEPFGNFMGGERRTGLIGNIVITRNYLTHGDSKLEKKAAKGRLLEVICLKMNALFRLQFLKLIGFTEEEIDDIVDKCPRLKGECNLWRYLPDAQKNERNTP